MLMLPSIILIILVAAIADANSRELVASLIADVQDNVMALSHNHRLTGQDTYTNEDGS